MLDTENISFAFLYLLSFDTHKKSFPLLSKFKLNVI